MSINELERKRLIKSQYVVNNLYFYDSIKDINVFIFGLLDKALFILC